MISPQQYRKLMKQYQSENHIGQSAIKAGIDRKTAGKYLKVAPGPEDKPKPVKGAGGRIQTPLRKSGPESKRCFFVSLSFRRR
jgi:hypothetical protein